MQESSHLKHLFLLDHVKNQLHMHSWALQILKHLHNVEMRFCCPQTFSYSDFQCRDDISELN